MSGAAGVSRRRPLTRVVALAWLIVCLLLAIVFLFPLVMVVLTSFKTPAEAVASPPSYWPSTFSIQNFIDLATASQGLGVYLGNSAASAVAREAARVARTTGDPGQAHQAGVQYAANIGKGVLEDYDVTVTMFDNGDRVRVTVTGHAQEISPVGVPLVSQTVEGPVEQFVESP